MAEWAKTKKKRQCWTNGDGEWISMIFFKDALLWYA